MKHLIIYGVTILMLTSCGRQGEPLTPHDAKTEKAQEQNQQPPEKDVRRGFILDPLLRRIPTPKTN